MKCAPTVYEIYAAVAMAMARRRRGERSTRAESARGSRCRRESEFPSEPNDKIADKLKSERVMPETIRGSLVDERDHRPVQRWRAGGARLNRVRSTVQHGVTGRNEAIRENWVTPRTVEDRNGSDTRGRIEWLRNLIRFSSS